MRRAKQRASPRFLPVAILILLAGGMAFAENIDPNNDGSKYAWAENLGWINARPSGPGGPGVTVSDSGLTGYAWSENAGWISLSGAGYGVTNNGCGTLSGFAWSENAGWINFAPTGAGVAISPTTGIFSGRAWSENAGWITFSSAGPNPYKVATSWRRAAPTGTSVLTFTKGVGNLFTASWTAVAGATLYDMVYGNLAALRSSGGDFTSAEPCIANDMAALSVGLIGDPGVGGGFWFLIRGANCGGNGTYDDGSPSQVGLRDAELSAAAGSCP